MKEILVAGACILAVGAGALLLLMPDDHADASILKPGDAATVSEGKALYAAYCSTCHGLDLKGQEGWDPDMVSDPPLAPPHDGTGHTWKHPDQSLIEITKYGTATIDCGTPGPNMPRFSELPDDQVIAMLSYIKSRWPPEVQRLHDQVNGIHNYGRADHD